MQRHLAVCVLSLLLVGSDTSFAQQQKQQPASTFTEDASELFETLSGNGVSTMYFALLRDGNFDKIVSNLHLTERTLYDPKVLGTIGGVWSAQNTSGYVGIKLSAPELFNKSSDYAQVVFQPPAEEIIPSALLSHLLAKAESTEIKGANKLDINLPYEHTSSRNCTWQRTLTIRLTSGALVANTVETRCDVPKKPAS